MKGEWGEKEATKVRVETQQGCEALALGLPEGRLRAEGRGVCWAAARALHGIFQARVLEWGAIAFSPCCS